MTRFGSLLLAFVLSAPTLACDTIFPGRGDALIDDAAVDPGTGNPIPGNNTVYPYSQGCNCAQGYACTDGAGCQSYTCFASGGTWWEAQQVCALQGMQLVNILDQGQNDFVVSACTVAGATDWWIGAQDIGKEGTFVSEGGAALPFTNWLEGAPDKATSEKDCVYQSPDGKWHDSGCNEVHAYACVTPTSGVTNAEVGSPCYSPGSASGCGIGQTCTATSGNFPTNVCTYTCSSDSECSEETRCTSTDKGKLCLLRCENTGECAVGNPSLTCIHTPSGDGVCWTQGSKSGEVETKPKLVLDHIEIDSGQGGVLPGATLNLGIYIKNQGEGDASDVTATVSANDAYVTNLINETGGTGLIPAGQAGVLVATPQVTLSPNLPLNQPSSFTITLNEGASGKQWKVDFAITAFKSAALVYVTDVEISNTDDGDGVLSPGETGTFVLYAENLGYGAVQGAMATVTVASGSASVSGVNSGSISFSDPTDSTVPAPAQALATGTISVQAGQAPGTSIVLHVTTTEAGGTDWEQDVEIPIGN